MKNLILLHAILIIVLLLALVGCQASHENKVNVKEATKKLSELQITACNTADKAGTCETRLSEVGIVLKDDCCKVLGKCCK